MIHLGGKAWLFSPAANQPVSFPAFTILEENWSILARPSLAHAAESLLLVRSRACRGKITDFEKKLFQNVRHVFEAFRRFYSPETLILKK
jgi:hypothetical protein